jgi:hypothetical protein
MLAGLAVSGSDGQPEDAAVDDADAVLGAAGVEPAADSACATGSSQIPHPQSVEVSIPDGSICTVLPGNVPLSIVQATYLRMLYGVAAA